MARSKVKMLTSKGKVPVPKFGAASSSKPPSPLMPGQKKSYKKGSQKLDLIPSFGETGMTGRS